MDDQSKPLTPRTAGTIAAVAMIAAAAPHVYFPLPFELHMRGLFDAFFGISVWPNALLAGVAFFFGADLSARTRSETPRSDTAAAGVIIALVLLAVGYGLAFENLWTDMAGRRPWGELRTVLPLYMGLGALSAVFWQGFVQEVVLGHLPRITGVLAATFGPVLIALPFFLPSDMVSVGRYCSTVGAGHLVTALVYALGFRVRTAALVGAVVGFLFVWFQQAVLL